MSGDDLVALCDRLGVHVSPDGRVSARDAARILGLSERSMRRMRDERRGPAALRLPLHGCSFSYRLADLAA